MLLDSFVAVGTVKPKYLGSENRLKTSHFAACGLETTFLDIPTGV